MKPLWIIYFVLPVLVHSDCSTDQGKIKAAIVAAGLELNYEPDICPSYCDSTGKLYQQCICVYPPNCCKFANKTLGCCNNVSLAIGDNIKDNYNCKILPLEYWEVVLAVCVPLAVISLFSFFAMLSVILVKRRRSNQTTRSRTNSSGSCSSWTSSSTTSPAPTRSSISRNQSESSGVSRDHSLRQSERIYTIHRETGAHRRHRNRRGIRSVPIEPPPYSKNPPSYKEIYGNDESADDDISDMDNSNEQIFAARPPDYEYSLHNEVAILNAANLLRHNSVHSSNNRTVENAEDFELQTVRSYPNSVARNNECPLESDEVVRFYPISIAQNNERPLESDDESRSYSNENFVHTAVSVLAEPIEYEQSVGETIVLDSTITDSNDHGQDTETDSITELNIQDVNDNNIHVSNQCHETMNELDSDEDTGHINIALEMSSSDS